MSEELTVGALVPDPQNARAHGPRGLGMLVDALQEVGAGRSLVIDEANTILAGNATADAAAVAGLEKVLVVESDGDELIAVRRVGLTPAQKRRLALYDNRTAELSGWDGQALLALEGDGLLAGLFDPAELAALAPPDPADETFTPNLAPESEHRAVTEAEVAATADALASRYEKEPAYRPVTCPHCHARFYVAG